MSDTHDHKPNPKPDGAGKLLGGFAAGNLSDQEKQQLYQAALNDQELFDSLLEDEGLRQLLEAPGVRRELIESLTPEQSLWQRFIHWLTTPVAWGAAGAVATAAIVLVVVANRDPRSQQAAEYAKAEPQATVPAPAVQPQPPPAPAAAPVETQVATRLEDQLRRKREQAAAGPAEPAANVPAPIVAAESLSKESELRAQPAAAPAVAAPPPPAAVADAARRDEAKREEPRKEEDAKKPASPALLAFDYQITPEGVQILPSEDGFAALVQRNAAATRVIASVRARKGYTETLRFPPNTAGQSFQVVLSRERPGQVGGTLGESVPAAQSFRATPAVAMAKRKAADTAAAAPASEATGGRAATSPGQSGRATAASAAATTVSIDVTAPPR